MSIRFWPKKTHLLCSDTVEPLLNLTWNRISTAHPSSFYGHCTMTLLCPQQRPVDHHVDQYNCTAKNGPARRQLKRGSTVVISVLCCQTMMDIKPKHALVFKFPLFSCGKLHNTVWHSVAYCFSLLRKWVKKLFFRHFILAKPNERQFFLFLIMKVYILSFKISYVTISKALLWVRYRGPTGPLSEQSP